MSTRRVVQAAGIGLALVGTTGCEIMAKREEFQEKKARSDALVQVQRDSNNRLDELRKELAREAWGRAEDFELQRDGTAVWLWRSGGDADKDKEGRQLGRRICILNPYPNQVGACKANEIKIGRILFEIEDVDKRLWDATEQRVHLWEDVKTPSLAASPASPTGVRR